MKRPRDPYLIALSADYLVLPILIDGKAENGSCDLIVKGILGLSRKK
jgi:hypothetical protein